MAEEAFDRLLEKYQRLEKRLEDMEDKLGDAQDGSAAPAQDAVPSNVLPEERDDPFEPAVRRSAPTRHQNAVSKALSMLGLVPDPEVEEGRKETTTRHKETLSKARNVLGLKKNTAPEQTKGKPVRHNAALEKMKAMKGQAAPEEKKAAPAGHNAALEKMKAMKGEAAPEEKKAAPAGHNAALEKMKAMKGEAAPEEKKATPAGHNAALEKMKAMKGQAAPEEKKATPAGHNAALEKMKAMKGAAAPEEKKAAPAGHNAALEKMKAMKGQAAPEEKKAAPAGHNAALEKMQAMKAEAAPVEARAEAGSDDAAPAPLPRSQEGAPPEQTRAADTGLKAALARMKAMKGETPAPEETSTPDPVDLANEVAVPDLDIEAPDIVEAADEAPDETEAELEDTACETVEAPVDEPTESVIEEPTAEVVEAAVEPDEEAIEETTAPVDESLEELVPVEPVDVVEEAVEQDLPDALEESLDETSVEEPADEVAAESPDELLPDEDLSNEDLSNELLEETTDDVAELANEIAEPAHEDPVTEVEEAVAEPPEELVEELHEDDDVVEESIAEAVEAAVAEPVAEPVEEPAPTPAAMWEAEANLDAVEAELLDLETAVAIDLEKPKAVASDYVAPVLKVLGLLAAAAGALYVGGVFGGAGPAVDAVPEMLLGGFIVALGGASLFWRSASIHLCALLAGSSAFCLQLLLLLVLGPRMPMSGALTLGACGLASVLGALLVLQTRHPAAVLLGLGVSLALPLWLAPPPELLLPFMAAINVATAICAYRLHRIQASVAAALMTCILVAGLAGPGAFGYCAFFAALFLAQVLSWPFFSKKHSGAAALLMAPALGLAVWSVYGLHAGPGGAKIGVLFVAAALTALTAVRLPNRHGLLRGALKVGALLLMVAAAPAGVAGAAVAPYTLFLALVFGVLAVSLYDDFLRTAGSLLVVVTVALFTREGASAPMLFATMGVATVLFFARGKGTSSALTFLLGAIAHATLLAGIYRIAGEIAAPYAWLVLALAHQFLARRFPLAYLETGAVLAVAAAAVLTVAGGSPDALALALVAGAIVPHFFIAREQVTRGALLLVAELLALGALALALPGPLGALASLALVALLVAPWPASLRPMLRGHALLLSVALVARCILPDVLGVGEIGYTALAGAVVGAGYSVFALRRRKPAEDALDEIEVVDEEV